MATLLAPRGAGGVDEVGDVVRVWQRQRSAGLRSPRGRSRRSPPRHAG
ncbi:hypothetical protein I553_3043 [Mycobacterium xenopi 4042]|uniref:Uncharacterized protein n=1 Tax=Mycobacterium xenopi 4042 TaxID=1299334 RepID=X8BKU0_MYCXE|nr:hypothetical protein I553_3043 [Mycobacterium xenopi 4042]